MSGSQGSEQGSRGRRETGQGRRDRGTGPRSSLQEERETWERGGQALLSEDSQWCTGISQRDVNL